MLAPSKTRMTYELTNEKWRVRSQFKVKDKQPKSEQTKQTSDKLFVLATPLILKEKNIAQEIHQLVGKSRKYLTFGDWGPSSTDHLTLDLINDIRNGGEEGVLG